MNSATQTIETIEGAVERVLFSSAESAFAVVKVAVSGRHDGVIAVGRLVGVQPGENLRLCGQFVVDKRWGQQFKVESYLAVEPATLDGIEKYLGSGLVPGIGEVFAKRLVQKFGMATLEVIEHHPERLREVEGVGEVRRQRIVGAWREQRAIKDVMLFLQSHRVSTHLALKIFKRYREQAIAVVKENPYRLAFDVFGIGFQTADRIAADLGVARDAPGRVQAGVMHVLAELAEEGHLYFPREELAIKVATLLEIDAGLVADALRALVQMRELEADGEAIYLKSLHAAEVGMAELIRALLGHSRRDLGIDVARAIAWYETQKNIELAPQQKLAVEHGIADKVLVITGGPGTGKTTLVNAILRILERKGQRILLSAPTGRAAKRLQETTGCEAKTIHRLLEFNPQSNAFERDRDHPLDGDLLVVDESSMIDMTLGYHLMKAVPPSMSVIFVGDVDQLPSVGPGNVLGNLIASSALPVVRLQEIFRQAAASRIVTNAHRVKCGELPETHDPSDGTVSDFYFIARQEPEAIVSTLMELVTERVPRRFGFDPMADIQVLSPMQRGPLGAAALNQALQARLNPSGTQVSSGNRQFRVSDRVMQTRNNYELEVYNGDLGRIEAIDEAERRVAVRFDDRLVHFESADLDELVLGYATTIHKSQGSEYPCVIVPLHTQHFVMLARNLLYTALTRGKKLVLLVGSERALKLAVQNVRGVERLTRLKARLSLS